MSCANDRFVLNKGLSNEFVLTIKQQGSTEPMEIDVADTFEVSLFKLEDNSKVTMTIPVTVESALSGKIKLTFPDVSALISERGDKEDRYYLKPTYRLVIDCDTVNNGVFVAKVPAVYVE